MDLACSGNPRWFHRWVSWCTLECQPLSWGQSFHQPQQTSFSSTLVFWCSRRWWWKWPHWSNQLFPSQSICRAPWNPMCLRRTLRPPQILHPRLLMPRDCWCTQSCFQCKCKCHFESSQLSSAQLNPDLKAPNSVNVILRVLNSLSPKSVRMIFHRLKVELPSVGQTEASVQKTLFLEKEKVWFVLKSLSPVEL